MESLPLLLLLLLVPAFGAVVCALLPSAAKAKGWALLVSLATLLIAVMLGFATDGGRGSLEFSPRGWSVSGFGFGFRLSCDAISYWLVLLTALLQPLAIA